LTGGGHDPTSCGRWRPAEKACSLSVTCASGSVKRGCGRGGARGAQVVATLHAYLATAERNPAVPHEHSYSLEAVAIRASPTRLDNGKGQHDQGRGDEAWQ